MRKKFGALLVTFVMLSTAVVLLDQSAGIASAEVYNNFQYNLINGDTEVRIYGFMGLDNDIIIPGTIDGKPVTVLAENIFRGNTYIRSVQIPNSVTDIGYSAFALAKNLRSVNIPNQITFVPQGMFSGCTALTSISIPNSVKTIRSDAFSNCEALASIIIPESVTTIEYGAFQSCYSLTALTIPDSVTGIGQYSFAGCMELKSLQIGSGLTSISDYAFNNCPALTSVSMGSRVTSIGQQAFQFSALKDLPFDGGVQVIGTGAFTDCYEMRSITIPSSVTAIGEKAFYNSRYITTVTFEGNAPSVGSEWAGPPPEPLPTVYYREGATGFTTPTWNGLPAYPMSFSPPGAPSITSAVPGDSLVTLSWSAPGSDGGAPIDRYIIYVDGTPYPDQFTSSEATIMGLTNGRTYHFSVAAHNLAGTGAVSSSVDATPVRPVTVPGPPTGLTATPGDGQVELSWKAPSSDGGASIDQYIIYQDGQVIAQVSGTAWTVTGLTNGVSYNFAVAAHNSKGTGPSSSAVPVVPSSTATVPSFPTDLKATPGSSEILVSWAAPSNNGGAPVTAYRLYWSQADGQFSSIDVNGTSYLHTELKEGQSYRYKVAAINDMGEGEPTAVLSVMVVESSSLPSAPLNLLATVENGTIALTWEPPAIDGDSAVTGYIIYRGTSPDALSAIATVTGTSYIDSEVVESTTYYYSVVALNAVGIGHSTEVADIEIASPLEPSTEPSALPLELIAGGAILAGAAAAALLFVWRRRIAP